MIFHLPSSRFAAVLAFGILHSSFVISQTTGQNWLPKKAATANTQEAFTLGNSEIIGRRANGTMDGFSLGTGLTLTNDVLSASGGTLTTGTVISGITNGYVLYNNAGLLGGLGTSDGSTAAAASKLAIYGAGGIFSAMENLTIRNAVGTASVMLETDEVHWIQDSTSFAGHLVPRTLTADRTWYLPDKGGGEVAFEWAYNVKTYGAAGDARKVTDAVTDTGTNLGGSTTVTSTDADFTEADNGKTAWVVSSVANGRVESVPVGTVTDVVDEHTITIDNNAVFSDSGQTLIIGTDDTTAFNTAEAAAVAAKRAKIVIPAGGYVITAQILDSTALTEQISIEGAGGGKSSMASEEGVTILFPAPGFSDPVGNANEGAVVNGGRVHYGFTIDCGGFDFNFANATAFIRNGREFYDVHVVNAWGTSVLWYNSNPFVHYTNCSAMNGEGYGFFTANLATWVNCYAGNCGSYSLGLYQTSGCLWVGGTLDESTTNAVSIDNSPGWSAEYSPHRFIGVTAIYGGPSNYGVSMGANSRAEFTDCSIKDYTGRSNSGGVTMATSAQAWFTNCEMRGSGTAYGLLLNGSAVAYDGGNNRFLTSGGGTGMSGTWTDGALAIRTVATGGTGASTLTANNVILGNGTSAVQFVAPGTSGNVLTSNGTTWTSAAPAAGLTIGTTAITSGTASRLLYETAGNVIGEVTGATSDGTTLTLTNPTVTGKFTIDGTAQSLAAYTTTGAMLSILARSITDTSSSGTVAVNAVNTIARPTLLASSATTYTDSSALLLAGPPIASTNVTQTRAHSLGILDSTSAASSITGGLVVATAFGTSATSVGIGGGNINAGGTIIAQDHLGAGASDLTRIYDGRIYRNGSSLTIETANPGSTKFVNTGDGNAIGFGVTTPSAASGYIMASATSATEARLTATGTGSNIDINLLPKGSGVVSITGNTTHSGSVTVGGGTAIVKIVAASATLDYDLTALTLEDKTLTVTGAAVGDEVVVGVPNGSITTTASYTGWVSASDTVTIRCKTAAAGENPASGTFKATVINH